MNPNLDALLSRLEKVRGGNGRWTACCPAHEDRSPSLAIRDADGKVLLHCFGGCSVEQIASAVGLNLADLFPPEVRSYEPQRPVRPRFFAGDLLKVVSVEATIVAVAAHDMARGRALPQQTLDRLLLAQQRIASALEASQ